MIDKFQNILSTFRYCGAQDTAYGDYMPEQYGTLHNHCGCVSYALQQMMGGDIMQGKVNGVSHMWNSINMTEVDLCSEQFGATPITFFPASGRIVKPRKTINKRFQTFWDRVQTQYYR
jgi:hypothetical protein